LRHFIKPPLRSQRLLAVDPPTYDLVFGMKTDTILRLAQELGDADLQWGNGKPTPLRFGFKAVLLSVSPVLDYFAHSGPRVK